MPDLGPDFFDWLRALNLQPVWRGAAQAGEVQRAAVCAELLRQYLSYVMRRPVRAEDLVS